MSQQVHPGFADPNTERILDGFQGPQDPNPVSQQCTVPDKLDDGTVPKGFAVNGPDGLDFVLLLFDGPQISRSQCLRECCALGPQQCQYLWFLRTKCYAVACDSYSTNCNPVRLPAGVPPSASIYIRIQHNMGNGNTLQPATGPPSTLSHEDSFLQAVIYPANVKTQDSEIHLSARPSTKGQQVSYGMNMTCSNGPARHPVWWASTRKCMYSLCLP